MQVFHNPFDDMIFFVAEVQVIAIGGQIEFGHNVFKVVFLNEVETLGSEVKGVFVDALFFHEVDDGVVVNSFQANFLLHNNYYNKFGGKRGGTYLTMTVELGSVQGFEAILVEIEQKIKGNSFFQYGLAPVQFQAPAIVGGDVENFVSLFQQPLVFHIVIVAGTECQQVGEFNVVVDLDSLVAGRGEGVVIPTGGHGKAGEVCLPREGSDMFAGIVKVVVGEGEAPTLHKNPARKVESGQIFPERIFLRVEVVSLAHVEPGDLLVGVIFVCDGRFADESVIPLDFQCVTQWEGCFGRQ